jgi:hypothetical protein
MAREKEFGFNHLPDSAPVWPLSWGFPPRRMTLARNRVWR